MSFIGNHIQTMKNVGVSTKKILKDAQELQKSANYLEVSEELAMDANTVMKTLEAIIRERLQELADLETIAKEIKGATSSLEGARVHTRNKSKAQQELFLREIKIILEKLTVLKNLFDDFMEKANVEAQVQNFNVAANNTNTLIDEQETREIKKANKLKEKVYEASNNTQSAQEYVQDHLAELADTQITAINKLIEQNIKYLGDINNVLEALSVRESITREKMDQARKTWRYIADRWEKKAMPNIRKVDNLITLVLNTSDHFHDIQDKLVSQLHQDEEEFKTGWIRTIDPYIVNVFMMDKPLAWLLRADHEFTASEIKTAYKPSIDKLKIDIEQVSCDNEENIGKETKPDAGTLFCWHYFLPIQLRMVPEIIEGGGIVVQRSNDVGIGAMTLVASIHARMQRKVLILAPNKDIVKLVVQTIQDRHFDVNIQQVLHKGVEELTLNLSKIFELIEANVTITTFGEKKSWLGTVDKFTSVFIYEAPLDKQSLLEELFPELRKTREVYFFCQRPMRTSPSELMFMLGVLDRHVDDVKSEYKTKKITNVWSGYPSVHTWDTFHEDVDLFYDGNVSQRVLLKVQQLLKNRVSWYDPFITTRNTMLQNVQVVEPRAKMPENSVNLRGSSSFQLLNQLYDQKLQPRCMYPHNPPILYTFQTKTSEEDEIKERAILTLTSTLKAIAVDRLIY